MRKLFRDFAVNLPLWRPEHLASAAVSRETTASSSS